MASTLGSPADARWAAAMSTGDHHHAWCGGGVKRKKPVEQGCSAGCTTGSARSEVPRYGPRVVAAEFFAYSEWACSPSTRKNIRGDRVQTTDLPNDSPQTLHASAIGGIGDDLLEDPLDERRYA